jgi:hypothetical protein
VKADQHVQHPLVHLLAAVRRRAVSGEWRPHFVQGISGAWFQTPFSSPPGIGESSPVVNVLWGFFNLVIGFALRFEFAPKGADAVLEWVFVGLGVLVIALFCAWHFGRVRARSAS